MRIWPTHNDGSCRSIIDFWNFVIIGKLLAAVSPKRPTTKCRGSSEGPRSTAGIDALLPAAICCGRPPFGLRWSPEGRGWMSSVQGAAPAGRSTCERSTAIRWLRLARWCSACGVHGVRDQCRCRSCSACTRSHRPRARASLFDDVWRQLKQTPCKILRASVAAPAAANVCDHMARFPVPGSTICQDRDARHLGLRSVSTQAVPTGRRTSQSAAAIERHGHATAPGIR
jgi:hypothetical protein